MSERSAADIVREALDTRPHTFTQPHQEAVEALEALREWHDKTVPIIAALAIYGERGVNLEALVAKARELNEASG